MSLLPSWTWDLAFVGFLFAMFYWMVSRTDKVGTKMEETGKAISSVLNKLADEFHAHQIQDARMFGEIQATLKKPTRKKAKAK